MPARIALAVAIGVVSTGPLPMRACAQTDITLEVGASQIGPPIGVEGGSAHFLIGGLRGSHYSAGGSGVFGSLLFGQTLDGTTGGSFLSGVLAGAIVERWSESLTASLEVSLMGYGVQTPFPYRAFAVEGGPSIRLAARTVSVKVAGVAGMGRSRLEEWRVDGGRIRLFEDELWRVGGTAELMVGPATSSFGVVGGIHRTPGGDYVNAGARWVLAGAWGVAEVSLDRWKTPTSSETTGGLALIVPIGRAWSLRGFFGRSDPDPLTLAQPGSGSGGFLLGRSLLASSDSPIAAPAPFRIIEYGETSSRVRLTMVAPEGSTVVSLLGDFTLWDPVPMRRSGDRWIAEIDIDVGTHHFGFLVDDEWYLPDDAPDVVPDEWGRHSATLVIEGVGQ